MIKVHTALLLLLGCALGLTGLGGWCMLENGRRSCVARQCGIR